MSDAAEQVRQLAQVARARNGRLAVDWISRGQKPRWKMLPFDGSWYNRALLRELVARRPKPFLVPGAARPLRPDELSRVSDAHPWRLGPKSAYSK